MRVKFSAFAPAVAAFLAACGGDRPAPVPVLLTVPAAGRYQATLVGYSERGCDAALSNPVGTLDAAARIGFLEDHEVALSSSRIWPYGSVQLRRGSPGDEVERLAWRGDAMVRADRAGCLLSAEALLRYFPIDAAQGSLHVQARYSAPDGRCPLPLPCQDLAIWSLRSFP